jgi:hypothetical protein
MQVREQWKNPADGSVEHRFAIAEEILDGSLRGFPRQLKVIIGSNCHASLLRTR